MKDIQTIIHLHLLHVGYNCVYMDREQRDIDVLAFVGSSTTSTHAVSETAGLVSRSRPMPADACFRYLSQARPSLRVHCLLFKQCTRRLVVARGLHFAVFHRLQHCYMHAVSCCMFCSSGLPNVQDAEQEEEPITEEDASVWVARVLKY